MVNGAFFLDYGEGGEVKYQNAFSVNPKSADHFSVFTQLIRAFSSDKIVHPFPRGFKAPTMHMLRGALLDSWVDVVHNLVESYRKVWKHTTGCTIMADHWTDWCRRTLINFLVYCPKGTIFLKYVDASHASKTADLLFQLFKDIVLFVGPENVVQFVTDNAANYVADIGELEEVGEVVAHASKITKYVYNHCHLLHLMRKFTRGKEILRPDQIHFATNFIALQSILAQKDALIAMVTSREWTISAYPKDVKAKRFVEQVLDSRFWKECADIVKVTEPLVRLLCLVDRYLLNPRSHFNYEEFQKHELTTSGLLDVIERHAYRDVDLQSNLTATMRIFREAEFNFGRQAAIRERNTVTPVE
ncbi:uncharacterized protein LOC133284749 [Gastrolobium bilobum]|uniref:uncharacterized protein LOC133284749 n=1 Tax=Gastrolobium bilobum TaxID=150636 RepID=UPI002AAFCDEB|nr:uncharacterized protein LOC133284749 [Gastrolobium bilobum]